MTRPSSFRPAALKFRGLSLLEVILALAIGGVVISSSVFGISEYSNGVKVQASASLLQKLTYAADRYAEDHFDQLVANAPQELPISELEPYYGTNIRTDAFRNTFVLSTTIYDITVPDPVNGGTMIEQGLQVLVVAKKNALSQLDDDPLLQAEVANTAGGNTGFISTDLMTCPDATGAANRPAGHICGAFGSFSFDPARFPATTFDDAAYVALATKGDSSVYGDQLYRYDFGDPELNTMHTTLYMSDNDILDPRRIIGVDGIDFDGGPQDITTVTGDLMVAPAGSLSIAPGSNRTVFNDQGGPDAPIVTGSANRLQLTDTGGTITLGQAETRNHGGNIQSVGSSTLLAGNLHAQTMIAENINSLHQTETDALRLQNFRNGQVIVGQRVRYAPGGAGSAYDISDGDIRAQHVVVQDITCADCGGSLSEILPKWRHMGTYYVVPGNGGTIIPRPTCNLNRREAINRGAIGDDVAYGEVDRQDRRYVPKLILIPKQMVTNNGSDAMTRYFFFAQNLGASWRAYAYTEGGLADALAMTYCAFTGGDANPASGFQPGLQGANGPGWTIID